MSPDPEEAPAGQEWLDAIDADVPREHLNGHARIRVKPEVQLGKDTHRVTAEVQAALASDPLVYQRAHQLVTVVGASDTLGAPRGVPVIRPLCRDSLLPRLSRAVVLLRAARPGKLAALMDPPPPTVWEETVAPPVVTGPLLACADWPDIRHLVGVTETPVLRPDGSVHQDQGHDALSGFLFVPRVTYPRVADLPTQADARTAYLRLAHVFADFPYASPSHAVVPVAALLTILARPAIAGPVPAFLFDASTRGSGKTLQADVVSLLATGRGAARATYPENDEELAKVLVSYALSGPLVVLLDNVTRTLGGGVLDAVLTAREDVQMRVLGSNETPRLPWITTILVSGNNLDLAEDTLRRVLIARLESPLETPEERTGFAHEDLYGWAKLERPRLVADALTVLRAYAAHGSPEAGLRRWGSYEAWSRVVAGALAFAGAPDPMGARPSGSGASSDDMRALETILRDLPRLEPAGITVSELCRRLYPPPGQHDPPDGWDDLRDAIDVWTPARRGPGPDPRRLGDRFRRAKGRVLGGKRLVGTSAHAGTVRWRVE